MDWKKHLFWIVCGAILLIGVAAYFVFSPPTAESQSAVQSQAQELEKYSKEAKAALEYWDAVNNGRKPSAEAEKNVDALKTAAHVRAAQEYSRKLDAQREELRKLCAQRVLNTSKFADAPTPSLQFDNWLGEKRQRLVELAKAAGLQLPADFDRLTFADSPTSEAASDIRMHREYRIRFMTVVDEVVSILARKFGRQQTRVFQSSKTDANKIEDIGALALDKLVMASQSESVEREKKAWENAMRNAGYNTSARPNVALSSELDMPYNVTTVDVVFVAHQSVVPAILQALESSPLYWAAISKVDFERAAPAYPQVTDKALENAKTPPPPLLNTYWREGPTRVLVSLELYEYDKAKDAKLNVLPEKKSKDGKK